MFGLDMMLETPMSCAEREKCRAEHWINKSKFWGHVRAGDLRTAGICVDSCSHGTG